MRSILPANWSIVGPHVDRLLDLPPQDRRSAALELVCNDPVQCEELLRLVAECEQTDVLLDRPAAQTFSGLFAPLPVTPPEVIGESYRIIGEIGRGGMAVVYRARDEKHGREVAVKVVRPEFASALGKERFLQEVEIVARLRHPHVVPLFDSGESNGFLYYVMPLEPGPSLRQRLREEGSLPVEDAVRVLRDVCSALAHAHREGVIHRDIKPENVLLSGRDALVTDFGVATAFTEATVRAGMNSSRMPMGTPAYMAPEQITAGPDLDHRIDLYAVGVLGYELLAGRPPFEGATPHAVLSAHLTSRPDPLEQRRPDVPGPLAALIMRCLEKAPAARWQHAEEMIGALEGMTTPKLRTGATNRPLRVSLLAAGLLVAGAAMFMTLRSRTSAAPLPSERLQVTHSGLAFMARFAPDGRVAYVDRSCPDELASCLARVVVESAGNVRTEVFSAPLILGLHWTSDSRSLVVSAITDSASGLFLVPSLGGPARHLSRHLTGSAVPAGDTVLAGARGTLVTLPLAFGAVPESVATAVRDWTIVTPGPHGLVALAGWNGRSVPIYLGDRTGRITDSLMIDVDPERISQEVFLPDGSGLLLAIQRRIGRDWDIVRHRIAPGGRFSGQSDTVIRQLPLAEVSGDFSITLDGRDLVFGAATYRYDVIRLDRVGEGLERWSLRLLSSGTTPVVSTISPDGKLVGLVRTSWNNGQAEQRLLVMPSDSGAERHVAGPFPWIPDASWTPEGNLVYGRPEPNGMTRLIEADVGAGTEHERALIAADLPAILPVRGRGIFWLTSSQDRHEFHLRGVPGIADTTIRLPGEEILIGPSKTGNAYYTMDWDAERGMQRYLVRYVEGHSVELAGWHRGFSMPLVVWESGPGQPVIVSYQEGQRRVGLYQPDSQLVLRLIGQLPRLQTTHVSFSDDGRRAIVVRRRESSDAYVIKGVITALSQR